MPNDDEAPGEAPGGAPRRITILGATGSVGRSTADVVRAHADRFAVEAVVGGRDAGALADLAVALGARFAAVADEAAGPALKEALAGTGIACGAGEAAVMEAATREADVVLAAISGAAGLAPTVAAMRPGVTIALANKECLVSAGVAFMAQAHRLGATLRAVDSEHNALEQALGAGRPQDVTALTLTASGGPFRTWERERLARATPKEALKHPTWSMGAKITIDSASLMNKGLELIEAHHLFAMPAERLEVLVHPQSIVHGLVHWRDGSITAGLAAPDMRIPIVNALSVDGARLDLDVPRLDFAALGGFTFERADTERFRCLALAQAAMAAGGGAPTVLNAANEIAVAAFCAGRIGFFGIAETVEAALDAMSATCLPAPASVAEALTLDAETRARTQEILQDRSARPIS
ncbi:1-deoxy-D-xylulose-5-phosphate reductoisomerase [Salinarimonas sp. NSM]|uniref:1-deoxy-D-xylulose-5-phosphate reductoisomerase n=1 Tax=Salinarimonas sp. NSM TaxID=3458003 RepID=UPI004035CA73